MGTTTTKNAKRTSFSKTTKGEYLSTTMYVRILGKTANGLEVEDSNGAKFEIRGKDLIENTFASAKQYGSTKKVSMTELAEIIENVGDTVFTVNFNKKTKPADVAKALKGKTLTTKNVETAMVGEERTLVGYRLGTEPKLGRTSVYDLEAANQGFAARQVDHRTINWIVWNGTKYQLK